MYTVLHKKHVHDKAHLKAKILIKNQSIICMTVRPKFVNFAFDLRLTRVQIRGIRFLIKNGVDNDVSVYDIVWY